MREQLSNRNKINNLVKISLLIALAGVGSYIKFPSPVGSIALDSLSGYLGVLFLGIKPGGVILLIGHLLSSFLSGFPLGALHLVIAVLMVSCGGVLGYLKQKNNYIAIIITILCNGILLPGLLAPLLGVGFTIGLIPVLLLSSTANILLAVIINKILRGNSIGY
ncbi:MAG: ECF transporter S component [Bacillota bacterium]